MSYDTNTLPHCFDTVSTRFRHGFDTIRQNFVITRTKHLLMSNWCRNPVETVSTSYLHVETMSKRCRNCVEPVPNKPSATSPQHGPNKNTPGQVSAAGCQPHSGNISLGHINLIYLLSLHITPDTTVLFCQDRMTMRADSRRVWPHTSRYWPRFLRIPTDSFGCEPHHHWQCIYSTCAGESPRQCGKVLAEVTQLANKLSSLLASHQDPPLVDVLSDNFVCRATRYL